MEDRVRISALPVAPIALALALAACSQSDAPSDEIEKAVEQVVGSPAPSGQEYLGAFAPRDACLEIAGADNFRQRLALAVEARDAEGIAALAAPDVKLDFGGGEGRAELIGRLGENSALWRELDDLMQLGCAPNSRQDGVTIPWYFAQDARVDPMVGMIVTGDKVPLRESPDAVAVPVADLNWDAVELLDGFDPEAPYQRVKFGDETGYVETRFLRSIIDYRLTASSRNGKWRITSFVAGD
jgi:hypothetical protein